MQAIVNSHVLDCRVRKATSLLQRQPTAAPNVNPHTPIRTRTHVSVNALPATRLSLSPSNLAQNHLHFCPNHSLSLRYIYKLHSSELFASIFPNHHRKNGPTRRHRHSYALLARPLPCPYSVRSVRKRGRLVRSGTQNVPPLQRATRIQIHKGHNRVRVGTREN